MDAEQAELSNRRRATRQLILDIIHSSGAAHIGSSFSVVEALLAVYSGVDIEKIKNKQEDRDRVVVSKGHSAAAVYAVMHMFGLMDKKTLDTYYKNDSLLSGHVSHFVPFVEHSTGALGHGLSVAVGIAIGLKSKRHLAARVYAILGDGEMHEGSNWEALMLAGHRGLNNLCALIDNNRLGGVGSTDEICSLRDLDKMIASFGFAVYSVDGHNEESIRAILQETAGKTSKPVCIICHTTKGKGVSFMEKDTVWHYRNPNKEAYEKATAELGGER